MRICSPWVFEQARRSFDAALRSSLERIVTSSGLGFGDMYEDHDVLCTGIVGIKHRHNIVCDTLVDTCFRSRILAGKEVDIRLGEGRDKPLRPADMLLYSWGGGLDVCVDLTELRPLASDGYLTKAGKRCLLYEIETLFL
ncbi:hypothetical protein Tco_0846097 [Tanacetum coccineum]